MKIHSRLFLLLTLGLFATEPFWTMPASAFKVAIHQDIVQKALGDGNTLGEDALAWLNDAVAAADKDQFNSVKHFDNVQDPFSLCAEWKDGVDKWFGAAIDLSAPKGSEKRGLSDRKKAIQQFGLVAHALADFYAHSNWVELAVAKNTAPQPAPLAGSKCDPYAFPNKLQSGWFQANYGVMGCPLEGGKPKPKPGFKFCHGNLNKDDPSTDEGKKTWNGQTFSDIAKSLAITTVRAAWDELRRRVVAKYSDDQSTDAECIFTKLAWGKDRSCHRYWVVKILTYYHTLSMTSTPSAGQTSVLELEWTESGFVSRFHWEPTRYPGPKAPVAYAPVQSSATHAQDLRYRMHSTERSATDVIENYCAASVKQPQQTFKGRIKVVPDPEPAGLEVVWPGATSQPAITGQKCGSSPIPPLLQNPPFSASAGEVTVTDCKTQPVYLRVGRQRFYCKAPIPGPLKGQDELWFDLDVKLDSP